MTNIFVGNLNYSTTQEDLRETFAQFGNHPCIFRRALPYRRPNKLGNV